MFCFQKYITQWNRRWDYKIYNGLCGEGGIACTYMYVMEHLERREEHARQDQVGRLEKNGRAGLKDD